jgi:hypothetical protein
MNATQPATPQERIAAMKARAGEKEADAQRRRELSNRRRSLLSLQRDDLLEALKPLNGGLPVTPNGEASTQFSVEDGRLSVCVIRKGWDVDQDSVYETLIAFGVEVDGDGTYAWITHDGDVIDIATALDLATAAVELRFDA